LSGKNDVTEDVKGSVPGKIVIPLISEGIERSVGVTDSNVCEKKVTQETAKFLTHTEQMP
jgi:hypothetical protein